MPAELAHAAPEERSGNLIQRNPNATTAAGTTGLTVLALWALGASGVAMEPEVAAVAAGFIVTVVLFVMDKGLKGLLLTLWGGVRRGG